MIPVEICSIHDEEASYLLAVNKHQGYKIYQVGEKYILFACEDIYNSPTFANIPSGTYLIKEGQIYYAEN